MITPCIKLCAIDRDSGLCAGCGRTPTEIAEWTSYRETERRRIMEELPKRLAGASAAQREAVGP